MFTSKSFTPMWQENSLMTINFQLKVGVNMAHFHKIHKNLIYIF